MIRKPASPEAAANAAEPLEITPIALDLALRVGEIDEPRLRRERLSRLRAELARRDVAGALLFDPMNIRYATGTRNMAVWTMHAPGRYVFVATEGPVVLFEFGSSLHLSRHTDTVDQLRTSTPWFYFLAGPRTEEKAALSVGEIVLLVQEFGRGNRRLAVDRCEPWGANLLTGAGISIIDAQEALEQARKIKTADELKCMQLSVDVCDIAIDRIRRALRPGITENQLLSTLHATNISYGGEWIECRLLSSGPRTNPWFQESSNRVIESGDMVAFDTDMVGPFGYLADLSRSFVCPDRKPTPEQRTLYEVAQEQILTNIEVIKAGLSFREFAERCWPVPPKYIPHRYMMMVHGAGFVDEYPSIVFQTDWDDWGYDALFEENMVVCVESFIGEVGGKEGVKLEQQVVITAKGAVPMSRTPLVDALDPLNATCAGSG